MPTKQAGIALASLGIVLLIGSIISLNYFDAGKWFPFLLIAGGAAMWFGVKKYRWAR